MKSTAWYIDEIAILVRDYLTDERSGRQDIRQLADTIQAVHTSGGEVVIAGNGGSWCLAEHFALDLRKTAAPPGSPGIRARALSSGAMVTAVANDISWERVFAEQLAHNRIGDLVIAISVSGISPNILALLEEVRRRSILRVLLTGSSAMAGAHIPNWRIAVPSEDPLIVEPIHSIICHCVTASLRRRLNPSAGEPN
jgi:D-sedoheptulose 7-phosphate isomerase